MRDSRPITIYGLADPRTGKIRYIGKTVYERIRLRQHINEAKRKKRRGEKLNHKNNWIMSLVSSGVDPQFIILETVPAGSDWESAETKWIAETEDLTNGAVGGQGPHGFKQSDEHRANLSAARKLIVGWHHSDETKRKIGNAHRGRSWGPMPEETKAAISQTLKGRVFSEDHKERIGRGLEGRQLSEESRQKVSRSLLKHDYPPDEELIAMAETMGWAAISRLTGIPESSVRQRILNIRERGW